MASWANLIYPPPTKRGWDEFTWHHHQHHMAIETGLSQRFGISPIGYALYPFFEQDLQNWLIQHQAAHNRFCGLLQVQGQDLGDLEFSNKTQFDAWIYQNLLEHQAAGERLATTIT